MSMWAIKERAMRPQGRLSTRTSDSSEEDYSEITNRDDYNYGYEDGYSDALRECRRQSRRGY